MTSKICESCIYDMLLSQPMVKFSDFLVDKSLHGLAWRHSDPCLIFFMTPPCIVGIRRCKVVFTTDK